MKFRVYATGTSSYSLEVEADSEEEALSIAEEADLDEFEEDPYTWSFDIDSAVRVED